MVDLSVFEANGKKMSWSTRKGLIKEQFPAYQALDWEAAFKADIGLLGLIIKSVLKSDQSTLGRPGPRPTLDPKRSAERYTQFIADDYSYLPIDETLEHLRGDLSIRGLANKVGLDFNLVYRILNGKATPSIVDLQVISKAFGKHPSYFLEYRVAYILGAMELAFIESPESSVSTYLKLKNA
jgi:transcriptional regulator with XRE-family HTH domain